MMKNTNESIFYKKKNIFKFYSHVLTFHMSSHTKKRFLQEYIPKIKTIHAIYRFSQIRSK